MRLAFSKLLPILAPVLIAGCASPGPVLVSEKSGKRIAIAQPTNMRLDIFMSADPAYPAHAAYRKFCDELRDGLKGRGFAVVDYCSRPNQSVVIAHEALAVPLLAPDEVDMILVPSVSLYYLIPFAPFAQGRYTLIDAKTRKVIAHGSVGRIPPLDPPAKRYTSRASVIENLPQAMSTLERSGAALGRAMAESVN